MAKIDQTFVLGSSTIEFHVGNGSGSTGQNALPPSENPIIGQRVVVTKSVNATVGSSKIVNPA